MAKYKSRFSKQTFSEYLKLGLALKITKDCLQSLVETEAQEFHQSVLQGIQGKPPCTECNIENIVECPTAGFCKAKHCPFHTSSLKQPRKCPNDVCNIIRDRIRDAFRQYKSSHAQPSWRNTDVRRWRNDPFQLMKCFLPPGEYDEAKSTRELDLCGLLSVIMNDTSFNKRLSDDLSKEENICSKVMKIWRVYRENESLTFTKMERVEYVDVLTTLLADPKILLHQPQANNAVENLNQIRGDALQISTQEVTAILAEAIRSNLDDSLKKKDGRKKAHTQEQQINTLELRLKLLNSCHEIFSRENRKIKTSQLDVFVSKETPAVNALKEMAKKIQESDEKERKEKIAAVPFMKPVGYTNRQSSMGQSASFGSDAKNYDELKAELKLDLINLYRERHSTLPLSPLIAKNKAPLLDFFVSPKIEIVDMDKGFFDRKEYPTYKDVENITDIFINRNKKEMYRNICLTSPPGTGKTSFIKYLALLWCQSHCRDEPIDFHFKSKESQSDLECIRNFEFLFFLSLRDAQKECEQDVMIKTMLIRQLDQEYCYTDDFLQAVLHNEKCLVLMDGLDEWRHPKAANKGCNLGKSDFPHTKVRLKCTTLSTSRPWSLHSIKHCKIDFDQRLQIQGLGKESSKRLVSKVICYLNNKHKKANVMSEKQFLEMISSKGLQKFESNPVILMQLLCLWYDGTDPGVSQCQIYSNMLELLFRRAECNTPSSKRKYHINLPTCFTKHQMCRKNAKLLVSLGKLAFATLFAERADSIYVFDGSIAREHLREREKKKCLEVGILNQSEERGKIATENIKLSFLHKTFQEYFAAMYLCSRQMTKADEERIFGKHASVSSILQLETVLVFLSGLAPASANELTNRTQEIVAKDKVTTDYRRNIRTLYLENRTYIDDYCSMATKCVKEGISNKHDDLGIFHIEDIVIDDQCIDEQHAFALKYLIETNANSIRSLSINLMQTVDDKTKNRRMQQLNLLALSKLEKVFVFGNIPRVILQSLLGLSRHTIKCLELWGIPLFLEDVSIIAKITNIQSFSILGTSMSHVVLEEMLTHFEQRSQLTSVLLNDIECSDHHEKCPGQPLNFSDKSRMSLLELDKVNLSSIRLNTEKLKWCIVEWLPIENALTSLLHCLRNTTTLERFDCEGPACSADTKELVATISTLENLKYLRLRNVDVSDLSFDICNLQSLKSLNFYKVTIDCSVFRTVIAQLMDKGSSVKVLMESCKVGPSEEYENLIDQLRSSGKIKVLIEVKHDLEQLCFKTIISDTSLNLTKTVSGPLNQEWEKCVCEDANTARKLGDRLLSNHILPVQSTLDRLCKTFGRNHEFVSTVCNELCVYIQSKSSKIKQIVPSYTKGNGDCIIFVVYTSNSLSRTELNDIGYSIKVRPKDEYSLAGKKIAHAGHRLSMKEIENLKKCITKHSSSLLSKHKMLSIISPSPVRSKQDGLKIEPEPCIALYVRTKCYIPIDEEPFETNYDGIPVDVREGEFITHPGDQSNADIEDVLKMGCEIGSLYGSYSGTLGGFIEHPQYGLCGFSCAHALLNSFTMNSLKQCGMINWPNFTSNEYITQPAISTKPIGQLVQAVYTAGVFGRSGVEVAMFQIERRHPNAGSFHGHDSMRFDSGTTHGFSRIGNNQVVKVGAETKKTVGNIILNEPSTTVRAINFEDIDVGNCLLTLHNQFEVTSLDPLNRFSDTGDSGSLVFMKGSGGDGDYTCVGMVEGGTTYGTSIVTPIISILEALNVPSLKNFETTTLSAELKNARTDIKSLQSQVNQLDEKIQGVGDSIRQDIRNLAAMLSNNPGGPL